MPPRAPAVALGAAFLAGCSHVPQTWKSTSGLPIDQQQLEAAKTACDGEATKANMAAGRNASIIVDRAMVSVYTGCMADHGYLAQDK